MPAALSSARLLDAAFAGLLAACAAVRVCAAGPKRPDRSGGDDGVGGFSAAALGLRRRFLAAFWLFKMADWLQGPYFFEVYASKVLGGKPISEGLVAKLQLTGFCASAVLSASLGRFVDVCGRRAGLLASALFCSLSALSTQATTLPSLVAGRVAGGLGRCLFSTAPESWLASEQVRAGAGRSLQSATTLPPLVAGRVAGGIGRCLFSTAPESWLASEQVRGGHSERWLSDTLGLAYLGDSVVAILAGPLSDAAAARRGPTGPFTLSQLFLAGGAALAAGTWCENTAQKKPDAAGKEESLSAWRVACADRRVFCVGMVQALFESAMFGFIMQWPLVLKAAMAGGDVPFGKVFSCFMASCMLGSSAFSGLARRLLPEQLLAAAMATAAVAMSCLAAARRRSFPGVLGGFLLFEACVGVYFPTIGTLRSKHVPDSHRGAVTALFGAPLNFAVVALVLGSQRLGLRGSLACTAGVLQGALLASGSLCASAR